MKERKGTHRTNASRLHKRQRSTKKSIKRKNCGPETQSFVCNLCDTLKFIFIYKMKISMWSKVIDMFDVYNAALTSSNDALANVKLHI